MRCCHWKSFIRIIIIIIMIVTIIIIKTKIYTVMHLCLFCFDCNDKIIWANFAYGMLSQATCHICGAFYKWMHSIKRMTIYQPFCYPEGLSRCYIEGPLNWQRWSSSGALFMQGRYHYYCTLRWQSSHHCHRLTCIRHVAPLWPINVPIMQGAIHTYIMQLRPATKELSHCISSPFSEKCYHIM